MMAEPLSATGHPSFLLFSGLVAIDTVETTDIVNVCVCVCVYACVDCVYYQPGRCTFYHDITAVVSVNR